VDTHDRVPVLSTQASLTVFFILYTVANTSKRDRCLQLEQRCREMETELVTLKQRLSSADQLHAKLRTDFVTLYRVACQALAQRDAEIQRLNSRSLVSVTDTHCCIQSCDVNPYVIRWPHSH